MELHPQPSRSLLRRPHGHLTATALSAASPIHKLPYHQHPSHPGSSWMRLPSRLPTNCRYYPRTPGGDGKCVRSSKSARPPFLLFPPLHPADRAPCLQQPAAPTNHSTTCTLLFTGWTHPSSSLLHLFIRLSSTPILVDTLDPPTMAAKGRWGICTAPMR